MYELVRSGRVPAVKIGRKYVLARATVQALANDIAAGRLPGDASQ
jgi:excisionase family DNA binding protein